MRIGAVVLLLVVACRGRDLQAETTAAAARGLALAQAELFREGKASREQLDDATGHYAAMCRRVAEPAACDADRDAIIAGSADRARRPWSPK